MPVLSVLGSFAYGLAAEGVWVAVGAAVGFLGPFLPFHVASAADVRVDAQKAAGLSFLPLITSPCCALISGSTALALQVYNQSEVLFRVYVCGGVNAAMFAALFAWSFQGIRSKTRSE
mmetsp:Transcript_47827/g.86219  ORF Transcript_47827/g.86219 Transcript_47827/m.86219 type:complete len:118 (-) Transcript_47827:207-560(-)